MIRFQRDDGNILKLSDYFKILSIEGLGVLSQEIFTEKRAVGDGDIVTGTRLSSRTITITACNDYAGAFDTSRTKINDYFNPKNKFKIYITYKRNTVWCECFVDTRNLPTDNIYSPQLFVLSVYCPSPYLKSADSFGKNIAGATAMMGFPILSDINKGFAVSRRDFEPKAFIPNNGAVDTYCYAQIRLDENTHGLKIYKNENEFILFTVLLYANQLIEIDFENKKVFIDGVSSPNCIDRRSTFFSIDKGGCTVSYSSSTSDKDIHIYLYYHQLYLGV